MIKYLKLQYFSDFIHKKILKDRWKTFFYKIFESKTIESLINCLHKDAKNIDKKEYRKIIDSVTFFNFNFSCLGQSFPLYKIFINGLIKNNENIYLEILRFLSRMFIALMHEILGHILIFIIRVLFDKNVKSPQTNGIMYSKSANIKGHESGEYLHVKLFGGLIKSLTLKELCFIFNEKNYYVENYEIFALNFKKCNYY